MENNSERRALILENAVRLFASKGYDGVGVQEICIKSEVTKPTLYYYFTSKAGLLSAIIEEKGNAYIEELKEAFEFNQDFVDSLEQIMRAIIYFSKENSDYFRLNYALETASEESEAGKLYKPFSQKITSLFVDFFSQYEKEELFARIFYQTCTSIAWDILCGRIEYKPDLVPSIIHSFAYGIVSE
ncbi:MAG: TetR/AcrR family transcriptional regulator [Treponema sp.]|nr:TetR/AcrR family transcriptional regulator [Treponema sp.]